MKKINVLLFSLLLALLAAPVVIAQDDVTLTYYTLQGDTEARMVEICQQELEVNVDFVQVSGGVPELMTELRALATADQFPDVLWMSSGFVDEFAGDGLLLNIQEFVDRDIMPQAENYFVSAFDAARYPDKSAGDMYAIPNHFVETVLYYNIDAFDAAGIDYPTSEWTWDDFRAAAEALTVDENDDGLADQYGYYVFGRYAHIESWVYQNNGRWLNDDKTEFAPNEGAIAAVEFVNSLVQDGFAPTPAEVEGLPNPFHTGLAAMWIDGSWGIDGIRDNADFTWAIAAPPRGPQWEQDVAYGWGDLTAVGATTEHPEEAWELVECLTGPLRTIENVEAGKMPIHRTVTESAEWLEPDLLPANKGFLLEWADNVGPTSFTPGWGEWRGYVGGAGLQGQLTEAFNGNVGLQDAIAAAGETANAVLDRFYGEE